MRNVHNDRHSARLRVPKVQYDHSTGFRTIFWGLKNFLADIWLSKDHGGIQNYLTNSSVGDRYPHPYAAFRVEQGRSVRQGHNKFSPGGLSLPQLTNFIRKWSLKFPHFATTTINNSIELELYSIEISRPNINFREVNNFLVLLYDIRYFMR